MSRPENSRRRGPAACGGAMLLMLMFVVALMGILLAVTGGLWHTAVMRDKEAQLLFVGGEYRRALARYTAATPPGMPSAPERLEQLLLDERQQVPVRHLRRLYRDPITDSAEWGLVKEGGRIAGVYSLGTGTPLKQAGFPAWAGEFAASKSYAAWLFQGKAAGLLATAKNDSGTTMDSMASPTVQSSDSAGQTAPTTPTKSPPSNSSQASFCQTIREILAQCDPAANYNDDRCRGAMRASRGCQ